MSPPGQDGSRARQAGTGRHVGQGADVLRIARRLQPPWQRTCVVASTARMLGGESRARSRRSQPRSMASCRVPRSQSGSREAHAQGSSAGQASATEPWHNGRRAGMDAAAGGRPASLTLLDEPHRVVAPLAGNPGLLRLLFGAHRGLQRGHDVRVRRQVLAAGSPGSRRVLQSAGVGLSRAAPASSRCSAQQVQQHTRSVGAPAPAHLSVASFSGPRTPSASFCVRQSTICRSSQAGAAHS